MTLAEMRRDYCLAGLEESQLADDPLAQFDRWFTEALAAQIPEPNAMVLSTVGAGGRPSARVVLLKAVDSRGFTFFTNYDSRKARELIENPAVALVFPWIALERQVIVEGVASRVSPAESEAYFQTRPRASQLAAWASPQSSVIVGRRVLEENYRELERKFGTGHVPRPPHWGGFCVSPRSIEFWQGRPSRLHDRLRFRRDDAQAAWRVERLAS